MKHYIIFLKQSSIVKIPHLQSGSGFDQIKFVDEGDSVEFYEYSR